MSSTCHGPAELAAQAHEDATPTIEYRLSIEQAQLAASSDALGPKPRASPAPPAEPAPRARAPAAPEAARASPGARDPALGEPVLVFEEPRPAGSPEVAPRAEPARTTPLGIAGERAGPAPPELPRALVASAVGFALVSLAAALYARWRGVEERVLSGNRLRLLELVREAPTHVAGAARALGMDPKTVEHHARVLARESRLVMEHDGRRVILRLPGQLLRAPPARGGAAARILAALREAGGAVERRELCARLAELPRRTRNHALQALLRAGEVEQRWQGDAVVVSLVASSSGAPSQAA